VIAESLVKEGAAYRSIDGEIRHVVLIHKPGSGRSVSWDSVPRSDKRYYDDEDRAKRPNGYLQMRRFQKWAVEVVPSGEVVVRTCRWAEVAAHRPDSRPEYWMAWANGAQSDGDSEEEAIENARQTLLRGELVDLTRPGRGEVNCTGAEWNGFYNDPIFWPEGRFIDHWEIVVDEIDRWERFPSDIPDDARVVIGLNGDVLDDDVSFAPRPIAAHFKAWRESKLRGIAAGPTAPVQA